MSSSNISILEIPISLRWKISKAEANRKLREINKRYIASEEFEIDQFPGAKYYLEMQKQNIDDLEMIILGLALVIKNRTKIRATFKIAVSSVNYSFKGKNVYENRELHGKIFCSLEELFDPANYFFINDFMIVTMEGILNFKGSSTSLSSAVPKMEIENLGSILWNRDNKDFAFIVDEKEIKVHKLVITAKSEVFERMIESGLKESQENKVFITDFAFEIVEIALKFCYGIEDPNLWKVENAVKLIQFADKYDINDLKISMETFLLSKLSPMNVCEISNASILSNSIQLREECFDFILECNKKSISVNNMKILDKDFALEIFQASFAYCSL